MASKELPIVGICRFSYLGFGDWRNHGARRDDEVLAANRALLFEPSRLEKRFATFEALTLPSLAAQTDADFKLIVLTSDELPTEAADHLRSLAQQYPFFVPVFREPALASTVANQVFADLGMDVNAILQFRLDDDDALGRHYIGRMRKHAVMLHSADPKRPFSITFPSTLGVLDVNGAIMFRKRHFMNTGAGQAVYHPQRNVLNWTHHLIDRTLLTLSDPGPWVMVTSLTGTNDSGQISEKILVQRGYKEIEDEAIDRIMAEHFPFITRESDVWSTLCAAGEQERAGA